MIIVIVMVGLALGGLLVRAGYLQLVHHQDFVVLAEKNRLQFAAVPPERGLIFDRNGVLITHNRVSKGVYLIPEKTPDVETLITDLRDHFPINENHLERYHRALKQSRRPHSPVLLRRELSDQQLAALMVNRHKLPNVLIQDTLLRSYPYGEVFSHVVGYTAAINDQEASFLPRERYLNTSKTGKIGIEKFYEDRLHGFPGVQKVEVDVRNRIVRYLDYQAPQRGEDLTLTLDLGLQQQAHKEMEFKRGVVIASDPRSGDILALVSSPGFDPNPFVSGIDHLSYRILNTSQDLPLFNRFAQGRYAPASTLKPFYAIGALDDQIIKPEDTIYDRGWYQLENDDLIYRNWKRSGHGVVNLQRALRVSSDTYFYHLATQMNIDRMTHYLDQYGLGRKSGAGIWGEQAPALPTRAWKREKHQLPWFPGDTLNASIGQGYVQINPIQLASAVNQLANRGKYIGLRLIHRIHHTLQPLRREPQHDIHLRDPQNWERVIDSLLEVMHHHEGTGYYAATGAAYRIAGKTGTAQVVNLRHEHLDKDNLPPHLRDHALFFGFAPAVNPEISVLVIIENGGSGGSHAAPIARRLMDQWLLPHVSKTLVQLGHLDH